jgi:hypothetical protein
MSLWEQLMVPSVVARMRMLTLMLMLIVQMIRTTAFSASRNPLVHRSHYHSPYQQPSSSSSGLCRRIRNIPHQQQKDDNNESSSSNGSTNSAVVFNNNNVGGNLHGNNACFLPLQQLEQDTYTPRIVYIAGSYPNAMLSVQDIVNTPSAEASPTLGQWTYTFPNNNNNNMNPILDATGETTNDNYAAAMVALEGSNLVASCVDPIIVIAEHESLGIQLPAAITEPVDLLVLVDREQKFFGERKFLLLHLPDTDTIRIAAYHTREEIPVGATILGQVVQVTVPWLPSMAPTKTGFLEADEYY